MSEASLCLDGSERAPVLAWAATCRAAFLAVVHHDRRGCSSSGAVARFPLPASLLPPATAGGALVAETLRAERRGVLVNAARQPCPPPAAAAHARLLEALWPGRVHVRVVAPEPTAAVALLALLGGGAPAVAVSELLARACGRVVGEHVSARAGGRGCLARVRVVQQLGACAADGALGGLLPLAPSLQVLWLSRAAFPLPLLGRLRALREVDAGGAALTDGDLRVLASLPALERLRLSACADVTTLAPLAPARGLRELRADGCPRLVAVAALAAPGSLPALHLVDLSGNRLPRAELGALLCGGLAAAAHVVLNGAALPAAPPPPRDAADVLPAAAHLHLCGAALPCVAWLFGARRLRVLLLDRSDVTEDGLAAVAAHCPLLERLSASRCEALRTSLRFALQCLPALGSVALSRASLLPDNDVAALERRGVVFTLS